MTENENDGIFLCKFCFNGCTEQEYGQGYCDECKEIYFEREKKRGMSGKDQDMKCLEILSKAVGCPPAKIEVLITIILENISNSDELSLEQIQHHYGIVIREFCTNFMKAQRAFAENDTKTVRRFFEIYS